MMGDRNTEDLVIVGGGLGGASAACLLAESGRAPLLVERETGPKHKVCGEFLSIEAQTYLARLGVDLDRLGASRISTLRLIHGSRMAEVDLPFTARGISRKVLDEALLLQAVSRGARLMRGTAVRAVSAAEVGFRVNAGDAGEIRTRTLFLASGKHDIRGVKRPAAGGMEDLIGFKAHYSLRESQRSALEGEIQVILFSGGYAGLQMVERDTANLCLVVTRRCFERVGRSWDGLLGHIGRECPHLLERLEGALPAFERPLSIFQIPYGFIHSPQLSESRGLFRIGDQAGVIPSYTGEGMSIALHSGCLAASTYLTEGRVGSGFHQNVRADIHRQIRLASFFYEAGHRPAGQRALLQLCRAWPAAMRYITAMTRMRETAVQRVLSLS